MFVVAPFLWALSTSFKDFNSVTGGATYIPWVDLSHPLKVGEFCYARQLKVGLI